MQYAQFDQACAMQNFTKPQFKVNIDILKLNIPWKLASQNSRFKIMLLTSSRLRSNLSVLLTEQFPFETLLCSMLCGTHTTHVEHLNGMMLLATMNSESPLISPS